MTLARWVRSQSPRVNKIVETLKYFSSIAAAVVNCMIEFGRLRSLQTQNDLRGALDSLSSGGTACDDKGSLEAPWYYTAFLGVPWHRSQIQVIDAFPHGNFSVVPKNHKLMKNTKV